MYLLISGSYTHLSTAAQEIAFTIADGIAYVEAALKAGLDVDSFAGRLSFFWNAHNNVLEEVAKFRASRRLWATTVSYTHLDVYKRQSWKVAWSLVVS